MTSSPIVRGSLCVALLACGGSSTTADTPQPLTGVGRALPAADSLFYKDARWLGGDGALTIPLSAGRTLWLFGDSFVSIASSPTRNSAKLPRNTVAIQTGDDPVTASMTFAWNSTNATTPSSFFPDNGTSWYWPGHGIRLTEGPLIVFLNAQRATPGIGLGFTNNGYALAIIDNPDAQLSAWHLRIVDGPALPFDAIPATAVVREGDNIIALAVAQSGTKRGFLVRYPASVLATSTLSTTTLTTSAQWYTSANGWASTNAVGTAGPTAVIDDAGAECSLHFDVARGTYVHVASYGFGATTIGMRTATSLTGPWSAVSTVYRPPESDATSPFVYAAKAHPTLTGANGDLLVTYVANSFTFADLLTTTGAKNLYWPRTVAVHFNR